MVCPRIDSHVEFGARSELKATKTIELISKAELSGRIPLVFFLFYYRSGWRLALLTELELELELEAALS